MAFNAKQQATILQLFGVIANETYGLEREALKATTFIPAQGGIAPWIMSWAYRVVSEVGMAKFISDYADDLPPVERLMKLETIGIKTLGDSYSYSEFELLQWLTAGVDVSRDRAETARRKIDEKVDRVLLVGDDEQGVTGLFNNANVTVENVAAGAATTTTWKTKTLDEIVKDVNALVDAAYTLNKGTITFDTIILPHDAYSHVTTTRVSQYDGTTILAYLKTLFRELGIVNWEESRLLDGAGENGVNRAVFYKKSASILSFVLPEPFVQKEAQPHALHYKVPCYARIGGTVIKNPKGILYADGL
ncbi:major capsid family protein [Fibrobacter sp. UWH4]|uniref:major capsid family protein n=1 Tax=Fibrobacter sp. UWH4 TaxID=1896210 RepID=UPI000911CE5D|nr:major capsid family protein [Fibrobacter sp. UWH4]SHL05110.1 hypothetical protein SAMN05720762_10463 [Fibrobacter sp. UWH4]